MQLTFNYEALENLDLLAKELVDGFIIGLHKSPYHGFSVEFAEHRLYNHGDNLKHVDWKVYGRKAIMFTKKFEEETNLRCCIAIDNSGSMFFPDNKLNKLQHSCMATAALINLLKRQLDAFAVATINAEVEHLSKFGTTNSHYKQQIAFLTQEAFRVHMPKSSNISKCLHELAEIIHQRSLIFVFTDIPLQEINNNDFLDSLLHLKHNKHEVVLVHLEDDEFENKFLYENKLMEFEDMESNATIKLSPIQIKDAYLKKRSTYQQQIKNFTLENKIDIIHYNLKQPITEILHLYLQKRNRMI
jgi:uncharacterized protein (DUF58 family)